MTWLAAHWAALLGWLTAAAVGIWAAVKTWRQDKQVRDAQAKEVFARAERDDAVLKARDAQIEAQATREQAKEIGRIDKEAKDARVADGGSLADDLAKLNRDANTPPLGTPTVNRR